MLRKYSESELKAIGKGCSGRFAPASVVQAMFLYEHQRETEVECLFQGDIFQLARASDHYKSWQSRVTEFGDQLQALRKQIAIRNSESGVSALKIRLDAMQLKLSEKDDQIEKLTEKHEMLMHELNNLKGSAHATNTPPASTNNIFHEKAEPVKGPVAAKDVDVDIGILQGLNEDIGILFDERDALANGLDEANARIASSEARFQDLIMATLRQVREIEDDMEDEVRTRMAKIETKAHQNDMLIQDAIKDLQWKVTNGCRHALDETASVHEAVKAQIDTVDRQAHQRIAQVERSSKNKVDEAELRFRNPIALAEQKALAQTGVVDKRADNRIAVLQQEVKEGHEKVEQHAGDKAATALLTASSLINQVEQRTLRRVEDIEWHANRQMVDHCNRMGERIDKLEDPIRALTLQNAMHSPPATQLIAVHTSNGQSLDLCIPKGNPLVPKNKKENVRSFTPGKQWMDV